MIGITIGYWLDTEPFQIVDERRMNDDVAVYSFINPLLDYEQNIKTPLRSEMKQLEHNIDTLINQAVVAGRVENASAYYRDLNNGPWLSLNDELIYTPASLLKVPLMMSFFKQAETDPGILSKVVTYDTAITVPPHNLEHSSSTIMLGSTYTVYQLIEIMITTSDNIATSLLLKNINPAVRERVYQDLAIPLPDFLDSNKSYLTAREYASFFRILYNSTYLTPEYSEQALKILSNSEFSLGIKAGLTPGTKVSHKFGVSTNSEQTKQLHNCGIVYPDPRPPYILCIMTSGDDFYEMADVIRDIAKLVDETVYKKTSSIF